VRAQVVSSTFPEAFGMVAAEAAACGVLPVSAAHSGLAEVTAHLAAAVPPEAAPWLSFALDGDPVRELAGDLVAWLGAATELRASHPRRARGRRAGALLVGGRGARRRRRSARAPRRTCASVGPCG
jgi:glycosyltransferase involved in cell wall biosynthesis